MEEVLLEFNPWWEGSFVSVGIKREKYLGWLRQEVENDMVTFIVGLRRVGKTTLMKQLISELCGKVDPKRILFVSMEHPAFSSHGLIEIVREFRRMNSISRSEKVFLFFDEVQFKEGFERDLKVLFDNENVKIFASGSSISVLTDKKAFLTGRHFDVVVEPLDFDEFLLFKGVEVKKSEEYLYDNLFLEYLQVGGMPQYVLKRDPEVITHLVNDIIYKDIISRHKLKNTKEIMDLFLLLCERVGKRLTYAKMANVLGISDDTVKAYVSYFIDSYLVHVVEKHEKSLNARIKAPKKVYIADSGIRNVFVGFKDKGAVFENLVFLKIKDKKPRYYQENMKEIDFVYNDTAIEAKYKKAVSEEEVKVLKESKFKNKIVANDWKFFKP